MGLASESCRAHARHLNRRTEPNDSSCSPHVLRILYDFCIWILYSRFYFFLFFPLSWGFFLSRCPPETHTEVESWSRSEMTSSTLLFFPLSERFHVATFLVPCSVVVVSSSLFYRHHIHLFDYRKIDVMKQVRPITDTSWLDFVFWLFFYAVCYLRRCLFSTLFSVVWVHTLWIYGIRSVGASVDVDFIFMNKWVYHWDDN